MGQLAWNRQHHTETRETLLNKEDRDTAPENCPLKVAMLVLLSMYACAQAHPCMHTYTQTCVYTHIHRYENSWLCISEQNKSMILEFFFTLQMLIKREVKYFLFNLSNKIESNI